MKKGLYTSKDGNLKYLITENGTIVLVNTKTIYGGHASTMQNLTYTVPITSKVLRTLKRIA